jgi:hypothetical protein
MDGIGIHQNRAWLTAMFDVATACYLFYNL